MICQGKQDILSGVSLQDLLNGYLSGWEGCKGSKIFDPGLWFA